MGFFDVEISYFVIKKTIKVYKFITVFFTIVLFSLIINHIFATFFRHVYVRVRALMYSDSYYTKW